MKLFVGTSGFAYKEWKGAFYPEDLPARSMLEYYATRLNAVEINNTFYRMPNRSTLSGWANETGDDFAFVLKASRKITHFKKLHDVGDELDYLLDTVGELGPQLGPMLFQLPPFLKKDVERLRAFLELLPGGFRAAMEFRSSSWFDEEVYGVLRSRQVALVAADAGKDDLLAVEPTGAFGYARLRRETYDDTELAEWAGRLFAQPWDAAYVFFKHEDAGAGPALARRFAELWPS